MAEIVLAVLPIFNTVVEDIHLLHAIRYSDSNYKTNLARLAYTQLQLSRWGNAVGLDVEKAADSQFDKMLPKEHQETAKQTLESMKTELNIAKDKMRRYSKGNKDDRETTDQKMEESTEKMRRLSLSRCFRPQSQKENKLTLLEQMRWGIYDQANFEKLLDRLTDLMGNLESLFPSIESKMRSLAEEEVRQLQEEARAIVEQLQESSASQVKLLSEALHRVAADSGEGETSRGNSYTTTFHGQNNGIQTGEGVVINGGWQSSAGK